MNQYWFNIIQCIIITLIGAFTFRVRGGLRIPRTDKKFPFNKWWFAVAFPVCMAWIINDWESCFLITGIIASEMCTSISGWGSYIGALYTGVVSENDKDDLNITYFVQEKFFPALNEFRKWCLNHKCFVWLGNLLPEGSYKDNGKLYGFVTLSLRGGLTTFILGLWLNSILYCCVGLLQGTIYWLGGWTCRHIYDDGKNGWKISEWYWGATLAFFGYLILK